MCQCAGLLTAPSAVVAKSDSLPAYPYRPKVSATPSKHPTLCLTSFSSAASVAFGLTSSCASLEFHPPHPTPLWWPGFRSEAVCFAYAGYSDRLEPRVISLQGS